MATRRATQEMAGDVFARMRADHRRVLDGTRAMLGHAEEIARGTRRRGSAERALRGAVGRLARQFATHMRAEDEVVYPVVERALPSSRDRLLPLRAEHEELRSMLSDLRRTLNRMPSTARDEQVAVCTQDLVDLLRIHVRKEEAIVFTLAEQLIPPGRLRSLAGRLRFRETDATSRRRARVRTIPRAGGKAAPRRTRSKSGGRVR